MKNKIVLNEMQLTEIVKEATDKVLNESKYSIYNQKIMGELRVFIGSCSSMLADAVYNGDATSAKNIKQAEKVAKILLEFISDI